MAKAICERCQVTADYRAYRGFRLAELACLHCATRTMKKARWMGNGWQVLKHAYHRRGQLVHCALCHAGRLSKSGLIRTVSLAFRAPFSSYPSRIWPAGTKICQVHEIEVLFDNDLVIRHGQIEARSDHEQPARHGVH